MDLLQGLNEPYCQTSWGTHWECKIKPTDKGIDGVEIFTQKDFEKF